MFYNYLHLNLNFPLTLGRPIKCTRGHTMPRSALINTFPYKATTAALFFFFYAVLSKYNQASCCVFCYSCLPAVQMWQEECGAQAIPFTQALWLLSLVAGVQGTRTSKITTCGYTATVYILELLLNWLFNTKKKKKKEKTVRLTFSLCSFMIWAWGL